MADDRRRPRAPDENMCVDGDGNVLPYNPEQVRDIALQMVAGGDLIAVIARNKTDGALAVQIFGPPSQELADVLEQTLAAYRRVLKGH